VAKESVMQNETEKKQSEVLPSFDFSKLLEQYKLPGVNFAALVDHERKNIEALTKANRAVLEGWQALVRRQSEILQETMAQAIANAQSKDAIEHRKELAVRGFEKALENMRELAEITAESQKRAFAAISKRVEEGIEQFRDLGKGR
jgi:phasin family protein